MSAVIQSHDDINAHGSVIWVVRDRRGRFVKGGRGRNQNKTNNNALAALAQLAIGGAPGYPTQMQLGTGTGTPAANDPGLFSAAAGTLVPITNWSVYQNYYAQYMGFWGSSTPAGNYTEAVLLDPSTLCWAHVLLQTSANQPYVPIQAGQTLTILWKVQLTGN
jgi:hypothetical protein